MECKKTIAMDPIAAAFDELYEKSPMPMLIPHMFTISDSYQCFAQPHSSGSFIRLPTKPRKKSILQSLKNVNSTLVEQDSVLDKTVDISVETSIPSQLHQLDESVTVNNDKENVSHKMVCDRSKTTSLHISTESPEKGKNIDENPEKEKNIGNLKESRTKSRQNAADTDSKVRILLDWNIKPAPQCRGVLVEGKLFGSEDNDVLWHSSPITTRIRTQTVVSSTGSTYKLKGKINQLASLESGFIMPVVLKFKNGFPTDWLEVIAEYYDCIESETPDHLPNDNESTPDNRKISNKSKSLVSTPTGVVDIEMLPRTKSGRRVKPCLAWWMGQRTVVDPVTDKLSIKCTTEKAESVLNHLALDATLSRKSVKHNTSHATKGKNSQTESEKLKTDIMDIIQSSKSNRLSKKVTPRKTCYRSDQPVVLLSDLKRKLNRTYDDNHDSSDNENTSQKHIKSRRKMCVYDISSSNKESLEHMERSSSTNNLRQRKKINYYESYSKKECSSFHESCGKKKSSKAENKSESKQMKTVAKLNKNSRETKRERFEKSIEKLDETCRATKLDKLSKQKLEILQEIPDVKQKKRLRKSSSVSTHREVLAKVGTLKRKHQLRDFLDKQNEDYSADVFGSTPLKKSLRKIGQLDCDVIDVFNTITPGARNQTPGIRYTVPVRSTGKTPLTNQISPLMEPLHRTHADKYINHVQKNKRKRIPKKQQTPSRPSDTANSLPVKALFVDSEDTHSVFEGLECLEEVEDEEDEDYYWTDEMEN